MRNDKRDYILSAIGMVVLTLLELKTAFLPLSKPLIIGTLLSLASLKMLLVLMVFMHLRLENRFFRMVVFIPIPLAIYFLIFVCYDLAFLWIE